MSQIYEEGIEQPLFEITMIIDHIQSKQHMSSIADKYLENYLMINLTLHTPLIEHSVGQVLRILFPEPSLDIVLDNSI